mmetsp:Transcript_5761/g.12582  ORF Transcript_5761/g.12582 Transcript_5761/m.12582 type:complete len:368 (+) Transcript_5761:152-1255(+)
MGGDGGTISSNRTYLRGAGKACHTADHPSNALKRSKLEDAERARLVLGTCAVSGAVLDLSPARKRNNGGGGGGIIGGGGGGESSSISRADIVACPYGKLYRHEKVLEALLQRSRTGGGGGDSNKTALGPHIRGMKDLHPVRFYVTKKSSSSQGTTTMTGGGGGTYVAACPITGSEIGSGNVPSFVIVRSKSKDKKKTDEEDEVGCNPNVLSERAIKEMGVQGLQAEYGPFEEKDMIRLAPPKTGGVFEEIQRKWEARMEDERVAKMKRKKDKKRKRGGDDKPNRSHPPSSSSSGAKAPDMKLFKSSNSNSNGRKVNTTTKRSAVDEARSNVQSAVAQNSVLSNLFGVGKKNNKTEEEKRIDLFTRNC